MQHIKGTITKLHRQYASTGWCAGRINISGQGSMRFQGFCNVSLAEGMLIEGEAELEPDAQYGDQWRSKHWTVVTKTQRGLVAYLSGHDFPSIGHETAMKLYRTYGDQVLDQIRENPEQVQKDCGLSEKMINSLYHGVTKDSKENMLRQKFPQLSEGNIAKIIATISHPVEVILHNPYKLLDELDGISFSTVDDIAINTLHMAWDDPRRSAYLLDQGMREWMKNYRATYVPLSNNYLYGEFKKEMEKRLGMKLENSQFAQYLSSAQKYGIVVVDIRNSEYHLYLKAIWDARQMICNHVFDGLMQTRRMSSFGISQGKLNRRLTSLKSYLNAMRQSQKYSLNSEQEQALYQVFQNQISCVCGGPGRGKTYWISELANAWETVIPNSHVMLFAPTGRAVYRLKAGTGRTEAQTICRFLLANSSRSKDDQDFVYSATNTKVKRVMIPLQPSTLMIVDESSMIGFEDAAAFLDMVGECTIVFVGDKNQLAPISTGAFLEELLRSGVVPVCELVQNMRSKVPEIGENADLILQGNTKLHWTPDFMMLPYLRDQDTADYVIQLYQDLMREGSSENDIMVLSPTNRGSCGAIQLSLRMRNILNPEVKQAPTCNDVNRKRNFVCHKGWVIPYCSIPSTKDENEINARFRIRDRIMCKKNQNTVKWIRYKNDDPDDEVVDRGVGIFNGDFGTIERYYYAQTGNLKDSPKIMVRMDDQRFCEIAVEDFTHFTLGYVLTVHKAQGTECDHLIFVMPEMPTDRFLLSRSLFYTGVTRAKKTVTIVGCKASMELAITRNLPQTNVTLAEYLRESVQQMFVPLMGGTNATGI